MVLPPPPLRIQTSVFTSAVFLVIVSAVMTALMGWSVANEAHAAAALMHERALWGHGVPAADGSYEGEVETHRLVFHSYKLTVKYRDDQGRAHEGSREFSALGGGFDPNQAVEVRYAPDDPEDFVLGAAVDMSGRRWASIGFSGSIGPFLIGLFGCLAVTAARAVSRTMRCARDGYPVEVELIGAPERDQYQNTTYRFRVAGEGMSTVHGATLRKQGPVVVRDDPTRALGVRSRSNPSAVILLGEDGYPFALSLEARDAMREAALRGALDVAAVSTARGDPGGLRCHEARCICARADV